MLKHDSKFILELAMNLFLLYKTNRNQRSSPINNSKLIPFSNLLNKIHLQIKLI